MTTPCIVIGFTYTIMFFAAAILSEGEWSRIDTVMATIFYAVTLVSAMLVARFS